MAMVTKMLPSRMQRILQRLVGEADQVARSARDGLAELFRMEHRAPSAVVMARRLQILRFLDLVQRERDGLTDALASDSHSSRAHAEPSSATR